MKESCMDEHVDKGWLLFNPVSLTHYRQIKLFEHYLSDWKIKCILNPAFSWFLHKTPCDYPYLFFKKGHVPEEAFKDVKAIIVFTAQPRVPSCHLIEQATLRSIPVVAIEEVHQMLLEQGMVNEYFLPVDHLLVASDYERELFLKIGVPNSVVDTTGYIFNSSAFEGESLSASKELKEKLGLSFSKRVATLCLSFLSPSNETLEIRKTLLSIIQQGLPLEYDFLVKPHPSEQSKDLTNFIHRYAPRAKIVSASLPIENVLMITDVLFNRGNSQVVLDALSRNIPVISIPLGRKTIFDNLLEEVKIYKSSDIRRVLRLIETKGFSNYSLICQKYGFLNLEESLKRTFLKIREIINNQMVYAPTKRLLKIVLFWEWMGFRKKAQKLLNNLKEYHLTQSNLVNAIEHLISGVAHKEDMEILKNWENQIYLEWIVQSLWIKTLFYKNKKLNDFDKKWLKDFPPLMARDKFYIYSHMLNCLKAKYNIYCHFQRLKYYLRFNIKNFQYR